MISKRNSHERGPTNIDWLQSMHSFSFGSYLDPEHMGYGPLRVINEDRVVPGAGFGTHPHSNMEIVSYVLEGALEHRDSMGNGSVIKPGDIQRMSAGTGVMHSEQNHSSDEGVHFLQIWFLPEENNIEPGYEQKSFSKEDKLGRFRLVMSADGREDTVHINQDINMYVGLFDIGDVVTFEPQQDRIQWVQIARGSITVNGHQIEAGDGLAISEEQALSFSNAEDAEVILFDMKASA